MDTFYEILERKNLRDIERLDEELDPRAQKIVADSIDQFLDDNAIITSGQIELTLVEMMNNRRIKDPRRRDNFQFISIPPANLFIDKANFYGMRLEEAFRLVLEQRKPQGLNSAVKLRMNNQISDESQVLLDRVYYKDKKAMLDEVGKKIKEVSRTVNYEIDLDYFSMPSMPVD